MTRRGGDFAPGLKVRSYRCVLYLYARRGARRARIPGNDMRIRPSPQTK
jgi:hypothetical protein